MIGIALVLLCRPRRRRVLSLSDPIFSFGSPVTPAGSEGEGLREEDKQVVDLFLY